MKTDELPKSKSIAVSKAVALHCVCALDLMNLHVQSLQHD